ncbi:hypothetical protein [Lacinutrix sp. Hel_I_90]|uniref:hypothetical protein n=1 Tax=Lacinutrix sp. Hel_I_90 TaxID=1249999 RepID=UPI0005C9201A|nr:hypothetical protein [Lacinutrix sp. Hel_I_90]
MKKSRPIILIVILLCSGALFAQEIVVKNDIALLDGKEYVKIEKNYKNEYVISNVLTQKAIFKIKIIVTYNSFTKRNHFLPQVYWLEKNKNIRFEVDDIEDTVDVIKFLNQFKLINKLGEVDRKEIRKYIY